MNPLARARRLEDQICVMTTGRNRNGSLLARRHVHFAEVEYGRQEGAVRARLAAVELRAGAPLLFDGVPYTLRLESVAAGRRADPARREQ